jgi:hypothetical protein
MDPDACRSRWARAAADGDAEEARAALADLREWRRKGGFPPARGWPPGC